MYSISLHCDLFKMILDYTVRLTYAVKLKLMKLISLLFLILSLASCGTSSQDKNSSTFQKENLEAKRLLQGVWVNNDSNMPFLYVKGDSLRFLDDCPKMLEFKIYRDSLYVYGYDVMNYTVDRQSEYDFWFHSLSDRMIKLYKSENSEDSLYFSVAGKNIDPVPLYTEVVQKDSVIFYNDRRFRGYVYINPSTYKIHKPSYSDEGIHIDEAFYDNIIHICVYEGTTSLFARDMHKEDFKSMLTDTFYDQSILADMTFDGVDAEGFHFTARIGIPDSFIHNLILVAISPDGKISMQLKESLE